MPREKPSVDEAIKEMARDSVDEARRGNGHDLRESPIEEAGKGPVDDEESLAGVLSRVSADEGYYLKIYRRHPVPAEYGGRPVFLLDLHQPEAIKDLEGELLKLAMANSWGDGLYEVKLFQQGQPGIVATRRIALVVPKVTTTAGATAQITHDPFAQILQTAQIIKQITQSDTSHKNNGVDVEAVLKTVAEAYKTGAESTKSASPSSERPTSLVEVVKALKELSPTPPQQPTISDTIKLLKELGLFEKSPKTEDDFLTKLTALKAAGLLPSPAPVQDSENQFNKVIEMVTTILTLSKSLTGGEGPASIGVELVRTIGPQLGKVVGDVTGTINKALETKGRIAPRVMVPAVPTTENPIITPPPTPQAALETPVPPLLKPVKDAIEARNPKYYPELRDLIQKYGNAQTYDDILDEKFTVDQVAAYVASLGGPFFESTEAKVYFKEFVVWAQAVRAKEVVAFCEKCDEEFIFDNWDHLAQNPNCPTCQTPLKNINTQPKRPEVPEQSTEGASSDK